MPSARAELVSFKTEATAFHVNECTYTLWEGFVLRTPPAVDLLRDSVTRESSVSQRAACDDLSHIIILLYSLALVRMQGMCTNAWHDSSQWTCYRSLSAKREPLPYRQEESFSQMPWATQMSQWIHGRHSRCVESALSKSETRGRPC